MQNVLALRGDPPQNIEPGRRTEGDFKYASDLITFIRSRNDFSIGAAAYPEGHPQSRNLTEDTEYL